MPLTFNVRHLEKKDLHLDGTLPPEELGLDKADELIHPVGEVEYDLEIEKHTDGYLVQGSLHLDLSCECARCLKPVPYSIDLDDWNLLLEIGGPEPVQVLNDVVDLTPHVREDIFLAFPQHPLCDPECRGISNSPLAITESEGNAGQNMASAWAALDKLKF